MALTPGMTIGRYEIVEPIGQGGMATVYKAHQPSLERIVALKVIRPGFSDDPEFLERFKREARAVARLDHPNVVQIYDFDQVDGRTFLAMQFLEGGTLRDRIAQLAREGGLLPQPEVARIVEQVAAGLAYAHGLGVIHRDVKPANIMLTRDGRAIVTDFGIARMLGGTQLTATGVGIGTPEYMSPEQGQGGELDARSDVYSLGVVAYELLTGKLPFTADTPFAVVLKHVRDPLPPPSQVNPAVTADAEQVLVQALAKEPAERHASVTELAERLRAATGPSEPRTLPTVRVVPRAQVAPVRGWALPAEASERRRLVGGAVVALALIGALAADVLPFWASFDPLVLGDVFASPGPQRTGAPTGFTPRPTPTPTPLTGQVTLRPEQLIMPPSEFPLVGYTVRRDERRTLGWLREFEGPEHYYVQIYVYVWPPGTRAADRIAGKTCDFTFSGGPADSSSEVSAEVVGDGAKACVYHWESGIVDWVHYVTGTRNVTVEAAAEPRRQGSNDVAMRLLVSLARQQLAILDRVSPP